MVDARLLHGDNVRERGDGLDFRDALAKGKIKV
jgi:hypothetical protein